MKKRELIEIKKQFTPANCAITRIAGYYVTAEKDIEMEFCVPFMSMPEEEMFKYFDIFRKALTGTPGRNMFNLDFKEEKGTKLLLKRIRDKKIKEDEELGDMIEDIVAYYECTDNYFVSVIHAVYDVPGKAKDGTEMYDASEDAYEYVMFCISPVTLSTPALYYNREKRKMEARKRDWVVGMPKEAFLYPAFTDRATDYDHVWYYQKDKKKVQTSLIKEVLGCKAPMSESEQVECLLQIMNESLAENYGMNEAKELFKQAAELKEQQEDGLELDRSLLEKMLMAAGGNRERIKEVLDREEKKKSDLKLVNLISGKKFEIYSPDATVILAAERTDLVSVEMVNGERYIKVKVDGDIYANGAVIGGKE